MFPPRMRALVLTLALVCTAAAQSVPVPTIAVTDENGVAVPSARVSIQLPPLPAIRCQTDFTGRCPFPSLPAGLIYCASKKKASTH